MMNDQSTQPKPFRRLLLTGAAGNLGRQLRGALAAWADVVRISDIAPLGDVAAHEEAVVLDLSDRAGVDALLEGVDAVVHMGGISVEVPFDDLMNSNILGLYNLYSAAQKHGVRPELDDPTQRFQGGPFVLAGPMDAKR